MASVCPPPFLCIALSQANARVINKFCGERDWIRNLAVDPATASNTSVCLTLDLEKDQVRAKRGGTCFASAL